MFGCREEVTVTSSAAERPDVYDGRKTSPGRELLSMMRFHFPTKEDKLAAEQADATRWRLPVRNIHHGQQKYPERRKHFLPRS